MDERSELQHIYDQDERINAVIRRRELLLQEICSIRTTGMGCRVQGSRDPHGSIEAAMERVDRLSQYIDQEIDLLVDRKAEMRERLARLPQAKHRMVLEYRYLRHESWDRVAERMGVSKRTVFRLHAAAMEALASGELLVVSC